MSELVSVCAMSVWPCAYALPSSRAGLGSDSTHWGHNDFLTVQESERNRSFAFNESLSETSMMARYTIDDSLRPQSPLPSFEAHPASPAGFGEDTCTRARSRIYPAAQSTDIMIKYYVTTHVFACVPCTLSVCLGICAPQRPHSPPSDVWHFDTGISAAGAAPLDAGAGISRTVPSAMFTADRPPSRARSPGAEQKPISA